MENVLEASAVFDSIRSKHMKFGHMMNKYEGWLCYVRYLANHVTDTTEKAKKAKKYRKLIARRDKFFK